MSELDKHLSGVTPPSPAVDGPAPEPDPIKPDPKEGDGDLAGDGRPEENVRGELLRKFGEHQDETRRLVDALADRFDQALERATQGQATPDAPIREPGGNPLDQYTVEQLQAGLVSDQVDDATKQSIQAYLPVRVARDEARKIAMSEGEKDKARRTRDEANQAAVNRYPELLDPASKMHAEVNRILLTRGEDWSKVNPTAVLDAANEAAANLGVRSSGIMDPRRPRIPGAPPGNREGAPVNNDDEKEVLTDADIDKIGPKLRHLLGRNRDGSLKEFDKDFLKKRAKMYDKRYPD